MRILSNVSDAKPDHQYVALFFELSHNELMLIKVSKTLKISFYQQVSSTHHRLVMELSDMAESEQESNNPNHVESNPESNPKLTIINGF